MRQASSARRGAGRLWRSSEAGPCRAWGAANGPGRRCSSDNECPAQSAFLFRLVILAWARACQGAARACVPAGLPRPLCLPFERSSHGLLVSNRSTGPIWPAAQLEVRHGAKFTSVPVVRRRVEGEASFAPCDQSLFGEDRPWLHPVPNARALLPDRGTDRSRIILLPKDRGRPPDHPIPPHRPFVATAQHVRRWEGVWRRVLGAGISFPCGPG